MSQQINLYQPIFRKEKIVFSAQTILWMAFGLAALLLIWSLLVSQRISRLEAELSRQQQAEQRAVEQVSELRSTQPPEQPDDTLQRAVESLRERREGLRESLKALEQRMPASEINLLGRLDALASEVPEGLWLTRLRMADQGQTLSVEGNALEARLVPAWLNALSDVDQFSGLGFRQIRLVERQEQAPGVTFSISTQAGETQ